MTLTVTFDLLQGQICCRVGDHNSLNLLVSIEVKAKSHVILYLYIKEIRYYIN